MGTGAISPFLEAVSNFKSSRLTPDHLLTPFRYIATANKFLEHEFDFT